MKDIGIQLFLFLFLGLYYMEIPYTEYVVFPLFYLIGIFYFISYIIIFSYNHFFDQLDTNSEYSQSLVERCDRLTSFFTISRLIKFHIYVILETILAVVFLYQEKYHFGFLLLFYCFFRLLCVYWSLDLLKNMKRILTDE